MSILLRTAILCAALLVFGAADATAQKRCSKGIPCGNTCIAANKTCRVGSPASRPSTNRPASASAVVPPGTQYVASNRGSTYYYVGCNGWKSLAPANRIYFKSVEEARSKGLKPSTQAGCAAALRDSYCHSNTFISMKIKANSHRAASQNSRKSPATPQ